MPEIACTATRGRGGSPGGRAAAARGPSAGRCLHRCVPAVAPRFTVGRSPVVACALLLAGSSLALTTPGAALQARVVLTTERGEIEIEVDTVRAPITGANFLRYVDGGLFDEGSFFRTVREDNQPQDSVRIAVIQGGIARARAPEQFPAIPLERTSVTGLRHLDGTVSMARAGPNTATSGFFITIGDQPSLDFGGTRNPDGQGFAAFARVVRGMDVVKAIHAAPAQAQQLVTPVVILSARRIR